MTTYDCILTDVRGAGARRIGADHAEPAEAAQRAQRHADGRARRRAARRSTPTTAIGCIVVTGSEKAFAAGADIQAMAPYGFVDAYTQGLITRNWETMRQVTQAGDRRGRRLRARRRLRGRDDVRHRHRRRQREVRPARDQARHHPRRRRHAAAAARGRQGQGDGPGPDRAHDGRGRGRARRAGLARRAGRRADGRRARGGRGDLRLQRPERADGQGGGEPLVRGAAQPMASRSSAICSIRCSRPRTRTKAWPRSWPSASPSSRTAKARCEGCRDDHERVLRRDGALQRVDELASLRALRDAA